MFIPIFVSKFPFVRFEKIDVFKHKIVYAKQRMSKTELTEKQRELIKYNRNLLLDNQISLNKIRFVFSPNFIYDKDNDVICPEYTIMLPLRETNGSFDNNSPIIEINKPQNLVNVSVNNYKVYDDNYLFLRQLTRNTINGIVIYLADNVITSHNNEEMDYNCSVDSDIIRLINLDEV